MRASLWYFAVGTDGWVTRQIEQYNSGMQLRYGPEPALDELTVQVAINKK